VRYSVEKNFRVDSSIRLSSRVAHQILDMHTSNRGLQPRVNLRRPLKKGTLATKRFACCRTWMELRTGLFFQQAGGDWRTRFVPACALLVGVRDLQNAGFIQRFA